MSPTTPSPQELDALKDEGFEVSVPRYLGFVNGYALNTAIAPFDDILVRQAVQHGIDRDEILSTVYTSDWYAAESFIQSNVPEATDHSDEFAYDPDQAAELLDEAGWVEGSDGVRTKDGQQLAFTLYPNPYLGTSQAVDELVAQQLAELGFAVTLEAYDVPTYGQKVIGNAAVQATEITRSFVDVGTVAGVLTSQKKGDEDWFKVGTSDEQLNELSTAIATATDRDERATVADELQSYVLEQGYFVPLTQIVQRVYVQSPELKGVTLQRPRLRVLPGRLARAVIHRACAPGLARARTRTPITERRSAPCFALTVPTPCAAPARRSWWCCWPTCSRSS